MSPFIIACDGSDHHARWLDAAAVDADDATASHRKQLVLVEHLDLESGLPRDLDGLVSKDSRGEICGWHVRKVARHVRRSCGDDTALHAGLQRCTRSDERHALELRGLLVDGLQVRVAVVRERNPFDDRLGRELAIHSSHVGEFGGERCIRQGGTRQRCCSLAQARDRHLRRLTHTDEDRDRTLVCRHDVGLADLAGETERLERRARERDALRQRSFGGNGDTD